MPSLTGDTRVRTYVDPRSGEILRTTVMVCHNMTWEMPFEIFVWSLLDEVNLIGGYPSTTFLSVPLDKVGFLFAADAASLPRPLNLLFSDAPNVEWMQP